MDFMSRCSIRIISAIILCFFTWSFGGLFDIAYALQKSQKFAPVQLSQGQKSEKKFEKDIDDLYETFKDTTKDTDSKKNKVKAKKAEIEAHDKEIKQQFSETEKHIKEKGLPPEILERHRKFVTHYEDNLAELKTNLNNIEKAKTKSEADTEIEKAKSHLEKVKAPRKHKPLDPNKLPRRMPEEKQVILEQHKAEERMPTPPALLKKSEVQNQEPLLVASNGSLKGILTKDPQLPSQNYMQVALATPEKRVPASDADLAETPEVQFTPAIRAKAAELGYHPVKMYEWVRNNIEYVPIYGSIQGADMCLQTKLCNDIDTASLLIALFRVSGIHARYAYGTIERTIENTMNWVGGFTDPMAAINLLASAGISTKGMVVGGQVKYVQMEHVWVEAWINYIPSRGARHKTGKGDTWIPLDASYKQYTYTPGIDIKTSVPFDAQSFIDQIKSSATINETQGYVTNVNSLLVQQTMQDYQARVQNYINQNYPGATAGDVLGKKEIIKQEFPYLLGTLNRRTIAKMWEQPVLPDNLRHKITFNVTKDMYDEFLGTPMTITKSLPELAGKKITLSYSPATPQDAAVINSYLPKPHTDGTPIQPNELPSSLPAYLINLKPELRIDGVVVATGTSVGMGAKETFTMTFSGPKPNYDDVITNDVKAGNYLGIAFDLGKVSQTEIAALKTKIEATGNKLKNRDFNGVTKEDILGDLLYMTALAYHAELETMSYVTARGMAVMAITLPSEAIFSYELKSNYAFGIPISVSPGGLAMDADRLMTLVKALDSDKAKPKQFMIAAGMNSSAYEHSVPEQLFSTPGNPAQGISAVKALQMANDQGVPIYSINQSNITTILPQLQLDSMTLADVKNAINMGKEVTVSTRDITADGWTGCGYIIVDPITGAGAYMISGGMSGASITWSTINTLLSLGVSEAQATETNTPEGIDKALDAQTKYPKVYITDTGGIEVICPENQEPVTDWPMIIYAYSIAGPVIIGFYLLDIFVLTKAPPLGILALLATTVAVVAPAKAMKKCVDKK